MTCERQASGRIALYFYGELAPAARREVQVHLRQCADCRQALDDLATIQAALASAPVVGGPAGGDWTGFMRRLEDAVGHAREADATAGGRHDRAALVRQVLPYLAMAAMLVFVTVSVLLVVRSRPAASPAGEIPAAAAPAPLAPDPALLAASGQHFQRSKLVLLDLATRDTDDPGADDWTFDRTLATNLLDDTRLYRRAAEQRGMSALAGVMRDLELVLLQTSMSDGPDPASLEQIQRLIRQRDLLTKVVTYESAPPPGL